MRSKLVQILSRFEIDSILDLACGDFNWMRKVLENSSLTYLGVDIVEPLIEKNKLNFENDKIKFKVLDVLEDDIPGADLVICRDLLFHLPNKDILKIISKVVHSSSRFFLVTSHLTLEANKFENIDIKAGDFRRIDLFKTPFNLPECYITSFEDWLFPDPPRNMILFDIDRLRKEWKP